MAGESAKQTRLEFDEGFDIDPNSLKCLVESWVVPALIRQLALVRDDPKVQPRVAELTARSNAA